MNAAPGAVVDDFSDVIWRKQFQKLSVIGQSGSFVVLDMVDRIGQCRLAVMVVVAVAFAIGRDMHQLRPGTLIGKPRYQAIGKASAIVEQSFKSHRLCDRSVIEKGVDALAGGKLD